jgi:hypothetical protein
MCSRNRFVILHLSQQTFLCFKGPSRTADAAAQTSEHGSESKAFNSQCPNRTSDAAAQTSEHGKATEAIRCQASALQIELTRVAEAMERQAMQLQCERREAQHALAAAELTAAERINEIGEAAEAALTTSRCDNTHPQVTIESAHDQGSINHKVDRQCACSYPDAP